MSLTLKRKWTPHPAQKAVMNDPHRFKIIAAGRRFGKTEMARHIAFERAWSQPNAIVWWVGPTYSVARDYGFEKMLDMIPEAAIKHISRQSPFTIELINDATLSFRSADREDALRGEGLDLVVIDEGASVKTRAWVSELRPTLSDTLGDMVAIGTPKGLIGWFHDWHQRGDDPQYPEVASFQFTTYQNPYVDDSEIEAAREDLPDFAFQQEYLAKFTRPSGLVYQQFTEDNIVADDPPVPQRRTVYYGVDWGFNSPAAIVVCIETQDGAIYVVDEFYSERQTAADLADAAAGLIKTWGGGTFYCDPAEPDSIEELRRRGIGAKQADNDVMPGIQAVTATMDDLHVHDRASNLIREMNAYRYPEVDDEDDPPEKPLAVNDHACDALRYAIFTHGLRGNRRSTWGSA